MVAAISLTPDNDVVGATIQIDGTGFSATEDITLTYGGQALTPVAPISTDGAGAFTGTFVVPASVQGIHAVVATDETLLTDDANFTVNSLILIDQVSAQVGDTIDVVGTGFDGESLMDFTFDAEAIVPVGGAISTDAVGGFTTTFVVIAAPNGSRDLVATDAGTNTDTDSITVEALVTLSVASGRIGASVTVTGSGFSATSAITIEMGISDITGAALNSDANGGFSRVVTVPTKESGANPIDATDASAVTDQAAFSVLAPTLVLTENSGIVGTIVTCSGDNYVPNGTITMTNLDGDDSVTFTANATGSIPASSTIVIPEAVAGTADINADDGTNDIDAEFTVDASMDLNPTHGSPSDEFEVKGHGYTNADGVSFTFDGESIEPHDTVTVQSDGTFTALFTVPAGASPAAVELVGTDDTAVTSNATFTVDLYLGPDMIPEGAMNARKIASATINPIQAILESTSFEALTTIDTRNFDKVIAQIQNIDDAAHTGTFNLYGSLASGENPPAFSTTTWVAILSDTDVAQNTSKSLITTDPYIWIAVVGKQKNTDDVSCVIRVRGITNSPNS